MTLKEERLSPHQAVCPALARGREDQELVLEMLEILGSIQHLFAGYGNFPDVVAKFHALSNRKKGYIIKGMLTNFRFKLVRDSNRDDVEFINASAGALVALKAVLRGSNRGHFAHFCNKLIQSLLILKNQNLVSTRELNAQPDAIRRFLSSQFPEPVYRKGGMQFEFVALNFRGKRLISTFRAVRESFNSAKMTTSAVEFDNKL